MSFLDLTGLKKFLSDLLSKIASAFDSLEGRVKSVEGDYLSKSRGGTVEGDLHTDDVYVGKWSNGEPVTDIDPATNKNKAAGALRVNGTTELVGEIITHGQDVEFGNITAAGKLTASGSAELGETTIKGDLTMSGKNINNVQSITVKGTVRGDTYKAPKLDANTASGSRIGKSTEYYENAYIKTVHGDLDGTAESAKSITGLKRRSDNDATWGNQVGTTLVYFSTAGGGGIDIRDNNPAPGETSIKIDGYFYQKEGKNRVLDESDKASLLPVRRCIVGQSTGTNTNPWYKFASCKITEHYYDSNITFLVNSTYTDAQRAVGILKCHLRTDDPKGKFGNAQLIWLSGGEGITPGDFVLAYKETSGTDVAFELWVNIPKAYRYYTFTVLEESSRTAFTGIWTLHTASSAGQAASITSGYTQIQSSFLKLGNSVKSADSAGSVAWGNVSGKPSFAAVATSGSYNDLTGKPTIPSVGNGKVIIKQAGAEKGSFTLNQGGNVNIELTDSNTTYSAYGGSGTGLVPARDSGSTTTKYLREDGKWIVPTDTKPNNGTITIQQNGSTVGSFTTNQSDNKTINITYNTGSSTSAGLTKLYASEGANTDGAMTQKAVTELIGSADSPKFQSGMYYLKSSDFESDGIKIYFPKSFAKPPVVTFRICDVESWGDIDNALCLWGSSENYFLLYEYFGASHNCTDYDRLKSIVEEYESYIPIHWIACLPTE